MNKLPSPQKLLRVKSAVAPCKKVNQYISFPLVIFQCCVIHYQQHWEISTFYPDLCDQIGYRIKLHFFLVLVSIEFMVLTKSSRSQDNPKLTRRNHVRNLWESTKPGTSNWRQNNCSDVPSNNSTRQGGLQKWKKIEIPGTGGNIHTLEERAFFSRISLVLRFDKVDRQTLVKHDKKEG